MAHALERTQQSVAQWGLELICHNTNSNINHHFSVISYSKTILTCKSLPWKTYIAVYQHISPCYSIVGIVTSYGLDDQGVRVRVPCGVNNLLYSMSSRPALGSTQPPIQWVPGALSLGVKQPGHEANHSPPASAKIKKMWIYTSIPPYAFMA
jgi:hypothetical protein